jgi:hypothetical protein
MPISYSPAVLVAYLAVSAVVAFGWSFGKWVASKLFK